MRSLRWIVAAVVLALGACGGGDPAEPPMVTLAKGSDSWIFATRFESIRDEAAYSALWAQHAPGTSAPAVDFSRRQVVAVFFAAPQMGYDVEIIDAFESNGLFRVVVLQTILGLNCASGMMPQYHHHWVSVPRTESPVVFETNIYQGVCGP